MKKLFILASVASLATIFYSCSKDGSLVVSGSTEIGGRGSGSPSGSTGTQNKTSFVSDWFSVAFQPANDPYTNTLIGEIAIAHTDIFGSTDDVKLVYARRAGREFLYNKLPMIVETENGNLTLTANFTNKSLVFTLASSSGPNSLPEAKAFNSYQYRYLSIPLSVFVDLNTKTSIDWSDYEQVATALNFPL